MMTYVPYGVDGIIIQVEADIRRGIPGIDITGLAEGAVREARERVRAAFRNSGFTFPLDRILINLAPAGVRKDGAALDLSIALAVMIAAGLVPAPAGGPGSLMVLGELELSGKLRPVRGALAAIAAGLKAGIRGFIVPGENAREAALLASGRFAAVPTLQAAVSALRTLGETGAFPQNAAVPAGEAPGADAGEEKKPGDFAEVRGQRGYKRILEIAAAGGHNVLVFGPPGAGKTMLARRLPTIMAPLSPAESVEVSRLHSLGGQIFSAAGEGGGFITTPPFRSPHHSASAEGILGGGKTVRPGEISLAHLGVLFLDEGPEFKPHVLQSLREPLEDGVITISRAEGPVRLPADFQLLIAANPCPCGRLGILFNYEHDAGGPPAAPPVCLCSPEEIHRYWRKFGGALLDRIELRAVVGSPALHREGGPEEPSAVIAARVRRAAAIQGERFTGTGVRRNARMPPEMIDRYCALGAEARRVFRQALERLTLSGRACHGILRVARTIADLAGEESIASAHVLEAVEARRWGDDPYDVLAAAG